jgi:hypothetical protein
VRVQRARGGVPRENRALSPRRKARGNPGEGSGRNSGNALPGVFGYEFDKHCKTARSFKGYECIFEQREERSLLKRYREGFRVELILDDQKLLKDVRFEPHRREMGFFGAL